MGNIRFAGLFYRQFACMEVKWHRPNILKTQADEWKPSAAQLMNQTIKKNLDKIKYCEGLFDEALQLVFLLTPESQGISLRYFTEKKRKKSKKGAKQNRILD